MKLYLLSYWLLMSTVVIAQKELPLTTPVFENQGHQEDHRIKMVFKNEYEKQIIARYSRKITQLDPYTYQYGQKIIIVSDTSPTIQELFRSGIIHPGLISGDLKDTGKVDKVFYDSLMKANKVLLSLLRDDTLKISAFHELNYLETSQVAKRYTFWLFRPGFMNPTEYLFELTNDNATKKTDNLTFIKGARITFFKRGTIII